MLICSFCCCVTVDVISVVAAAFIAVNVVIVFVAVGVAVDVNNVAAAVNVTFVVSAAVANIAATAVVAIVDNVVPITVFYIFVGVLVFTETVVLLFCPYYHFMLAHSPHKSPLYFLQYSSQFSHQLLDLFISYLNSKLHSKT